MKKKFFAFLSIAVLVVSFSTACKTEKGDMTLKKGVLSIGVEIEYPPMEYYDADGNPAGFDIELGNAIASELGLKAEFIDTAWDSIFTGFDANKYDCIISSITILPERLVAHNFSKPYIANSLSMVLLKGSDIAARTPEELEGLNVAYQSDTTSEFYMQELAAKGLKYNAHGFEKVMYCFNELRLGRVDVIVTDLLVAESYIAQENSPFEIVWNSDEPEEFGICIKKGNDALTKAINEILDKLYEDGTLVKISYDYFGKDLVSAVRK